MNNVTINPKEAQRARIIEEVLSGRINGSEAAKELGITTRQIRRIKARYQKEGIGGLAHKGRGKVSNRAMEKQKKAEIICRLHEQYSDFGATLASEVLFERDGIKVGKETIRQIQIDEKLHKPRKAQKVVYRSWREPRASKGELVQFDGSYEYWFEDRGAKCCLLAAVDDATGEIMEAVFVEGNESIRNVFSFWKEYVQTIGKPKAIYVDRFSTYKQNNLSVEENLKTQFGRVMEEELAIELIFAHSPQAKGRIEKLFDTLQDRLIKLMRLEEISDIPTANVYLKEIFIPSFNKKFGRIAREATDMHHRLSSKEKEEMDFVFSTRYERVIANDFTLTYRYRFFQLEKKQKIYLKPAEKVFVYESLMGNIYLKPIKNTAILLQFKEIKQREKKIIIHEKKERLHKKVSPNHPWKHSDPFLYHRN